jgi:hypothetical protein
MRELASVSEVIRAAERNLARQTYVSQQHLYYLTPLGWRFWGFWCGAQKPLPWRKTYCP